MTIGTDLPRIRDGDASKQEHGACPGGIPRIPPADRIARLDGRRGAGDVRAHHLPPIARQIEHEPVQLATQRSRHRRIDRENETPAIFDGRHRRARPNPPLGHRPQRRRMHPLEPVLVEGLMGGPGIGPAHDRRGKLLADLPVRRSRHPPVDRLARHRIRTRIPVKGHPGDICRDRRPQFHRGTADLGLRVGHGLFGAPTRQQEKREHGKQGNGIFRLDEQIVEISQKL